MYHRVLRLVTILTLALTAAGQASAQSGGWWRAGSQTIQTSGDAAAIALDSKASGSAVRIEARQGRIDIQAVIVRYGAGRVVVEERPIRLAQGERTRPIELGTRDEPLQSVEIVLAPGQNGAATVEVWTRAKAAPEVTSTSAPAAATPATPTGQRPEGGGQVDSRGLIIKGIMKEQPKTVGGGGGAPPRTRSGGHVSGVPVDRTAGSSEPAPATRAVEPGEPKAVSEGRPVGRTTYSYSLSTLDACVADKSCTAVPVFFGTDRNQAGTPTGRITFGTERAGRVQLGRVYVTVPSRNRHKGQLTVPGTMDWLRGTPEGGDPKRHFTIPASGITLYGSEADFLTAVREHIASGVGTFKDHAFVYVHGYRTPWEFAAMRTAQIAYDLSPDDAPFGTPFLYSWPSQGAAADYITDLDNSRIAIPHLVSFLRMVVERSGASNVHVIAHSMGNFPVMHALAEIAGTAPGVKFSQVVLAAPDVEKKEFEDVSKSVVKVAKGVTLYASSSDIALLVSRLVRRDKPRAGDAKDPPGPALVEGMDTVDISRLSTGFMSYFSWNHDKYADSPVLLNDISTLFRKGERPPSARNVSFRMYQARFWRYED